MRDFIAYIIAPIMKVTGFRFSKEYRHAENGFKAFIYRRINTIKANIIAGI